MNIEKYDENGPVIHPESPQAKVHPEISNTHCWISKAQRNFKEKRQYVQVFEKYNGPIEKGLFVCHKCDNTECCNPLHLFKGTQKDNLQDMIKKGRQNHVVVYGVKHIVTQEQRKLISEHTKKAMGRPEVIEKLKNRRPGWSPSIETRLKHKIAMQKSWERRRNEKKSIIL